MDEIASNHHIKSLCTVHSLWPSLSQANRTSWRLCSALSIHYAQFYTNFMVQRYFRSKNSTKAALLWRCFFPSQHFTELSFFVHFCYIEAIVVIVLSLNLPLVVRRLSPLTRIHSIFLCVALVSSTFRSRLVELWSALNMVQFNVMNFHLLPWSKQQQRAERSSKKYSGDSNRFFFSILHSSDSLLFFLSFFLCAPTQNLNTRNELKRSNGCTWKIFSRARVLLQRRMTDNAQTD